VSYANGRGVERDGAEAANWYRKAAEQGYASAQYNLGVKYAKGRGVAQNDAEAMKWIAKAVEQANENAKKALADMKNRASSVAK